jgi:hypothetical protein
MVLHPAYLYLGPTHKTKQLCKAFIQEVLCAQKCTTCTHCVGIEKEQHYLVRWIVPEHHYTVAQLEIIFKTIAFTLEAHEHFFFVLEQAELLNPTCANSLLKSLEEPPAGYHFILLAQRREGILPTISSRCVLKVHDSSLSDSISVLQPFFTSLTVQVTEFSKELERIKIAELDILHFLDQLYTYWVHSLYTHIQELDEKKCDHARKVLALLDDARLYAPMPGSGKLFLKNLFLRYIAL